MGRCSAPLESSKCVSEPKKWKSFLHPLPLGKQNEHICGHGGSFRDQKRLQCAFMVEKSDTARMSGGGRVRNGHGASLPGEGGWVGSGWGGVGWGGGWWRCPPLLGPYKTYPALPSAPDVHFRHFGVTSPHFASYRLTSPLLTTLWHMFASPRHTFASLRSTRPLIFYDKSPLAPFGLPLGSVWLPFAPLGVPIGSL